MTITFNLVLTLIETKGRGTTSIRREKDERGTSLDDIPGIYLYLFWWDQQILEQNQGRGGKDGKTNGPPCSVLAIKHLASS